MAFCERQQKQFAIRKPFWREPSARSMLYAHQPQLRGYLTMGVILLGHTDASKVQCIACGKLLSLGSNKPGKQTVHGLKCHLEKCHKDNLYTVHEESGISSTKTTYKKAKLDEVLAAHCRANLVTECMKKKKTLILSGDFRFRFPAENECQFSFSFRFRP